MFPTARVLSTRHSIHPIPRITEFIHLLIHPPRHHHSSAPWSLLLRPVSETRLLLLLTAAPAAVEVRSQLSHFAISYADFPSPSPLPCPSLPPHLVLNTLLRISPHFRLSVQVFPSSFAKAITRALTGYGVSRETPQGFLFKRVAASVVKAFTELGGDDQGLHGVGMCRVTGSGSVGDLWVVYFCG